MYGIVINDHTRKYIAKTYNEGVVPEIEIPATVYVVSEDPETPNDIKSLAMFMQENGRHPKHDTALYTRVTDRLKNR